MPRREDIRTRAQQIPSIPGAMNDQLTRIRELETGAELIVYVGTPTIDGVDDLLTEESPPFNNGHTTDLDDPVHFIVENGGWIQGGGRPLGGTPGSSIYTMPADYRPDRRIPFVSYDVNGGAVAAGWIDPDGQVYLTAIAAEVSPITPVLITSPTLSDRIRWNGTAWVNSDLIWRPVMSLDPISGNYLPVATGDGEAVLTEA